MVERQPSSRSCFLCGRDNPVSLKVVWENDRELDQIRTTVTVAEEYNGYPGVVHGGVVAALLDETAGRSIMLEGGTEEFLVTLKLDVTYRRPTPTRTPLTVVGWVERRTANRAHVAGEIRLPDGTVTAACTAVVVRPPAEFFDAWMAEREHWRVDET